MAGESSELPSGTASGADGLDDEKPEDAWTRIRGELAGLDEEQLWNELGVRADYPGGDREENLRLAALVHTLADRDETAKDAFEAWKRGPADGSASGHIVAWMFRYTNRKVAET